MRLTGPVGTLSHGEMEAGDGVIMLATPTLAYESPKRHRETCERARRWLDVPWIVDGVLVYVDDLDAHYRRAKAAGATILSEIEDGPPGRRFRAEDFEGHRWFFFSEKAVDVGALFGRNKVPGTNLAENRYQVLVFGQIVRLAPSNFKDPALKGSHLA